MVVMVLFLPNSIDIDTDGSANWRNISCGDVLDNEWDIRDFFQIRVHTKYFQSSFACVQVFLKKESILSAKGSHREAHKFWD